MGFKTPAQRVSSTRSFVFSLENPTCFNLLKAEPLQQVDDWLAPYAAAWDERLARLEEYLDGDHDEGD